jgi:glycosyltransferase involved in cell wall biosynthesis
VKIIYGLPLRYPTEKAYGINVAYTMRAFSKLGYRTEIWSLSSDKRDFLENEVYGLGISDANFVRFLQESKISFFQSIGFYLVQVLFSFKSVFRFSKMKSKERSEEYVIITRSALTAFGYYFMRNKIKKIVLEQHHLPSRIECFLIRLMTDNQKFKLVVTNESFANQLSTLGITRECQIVPNAAPDEFFRLGEKTHILKQVLNIGYAGKASSSGNDNGLMIIINFLETQRNKCDFVRFTLVGVGMDFEQIVKNRVATGKIRKDSIEVLPHVSHKELIDIIANFDLALIPYPESPYYERSFPIKILEMTAAGIPLLASRTKAHERILEESFTTFYQTSDVDSFIGAIAQVNIGRSSLEQARRNAIHWASKFQYSERAKQLIK